MLWPGHITTKNTHQPRFAWCLNLALPTQTSWASLEISSIPRPCLLLVSIRLCRRPATDPPPTHHHPNTSFETGYTAETLRFGQTAPAGQSVLGKWSPCRPRRITERSLRCATRSFQVESFPPTPFETACRGLACVDTFATHFSLGLRNRARWFQPSRHRRPDLRPALVQHIPPCSLSEIAGSRRRLVTPPRAPSPSVLFVISKWLTPCAFRVTCAFAS